MIQTIPELIASQACFSIGTPLYCFRREEVVSGPTELVVPGPTELVVPGPTGLA